MESIAAPLRPHRPPLFGLKVITFLSGSLTSMAHIWLGLPAQLCEVVVKMTLFHMFSEYDLPFGISELEQAA